MNVSPILLTVATQPTRPLGWGPTLLYLFGVIAAWIWLGYMMRSGLDKITRQVDPEVIMERKKADAFEKALIRNAWRPKWKRR